jgi:hypothetical protein
MKLMEKEIEIYKLKLKNCKDNLQYSFSKVKEAQEEIAVLEEILRRLKA